MNEKERRRAMYLEMQKNEEMAKTIRLARRWPFILLGIVGLMFLGMFLWLGSIMP